MNEFRENASAPDSGFRLRQRLGLALGPAAFASMLLLPPPPELAAPGWQVAAVAVLMAVWWVSEAIPIPITALLPIILFPLLGVGTIGEATAPYANPIIFLFLGGFLIALAMQRWNLHRRIALTILHLVGSSPAAIVGGFMAATALLSMWISNTATTAMMLPVGLALVELVTGAAGKRDRAPAGGNFGVALMLGIAYAATIGGLGTLIGTPPNALLAGYLRETQGIELGFLRWMLIGVPLVIVLLPIAWLLLTRILFPVGSAEIAGGADLIRNELRRLGPISRPEMMVAGVFALTALLWMARPLVESLVPALQLSDPGIALIGATLLFLLPANLKAGEFLLNWQWAARVPWRVLLLFGGGLSLAAAIDRSGLAAWIGEWMAGSAAFPRTLMVMGIVAVIILLTELTSNTATAASFLPIAGALALGIGESPAALAAVAALGASCAFMLPVATPPNAIVFGSGYLAIPHMVRAGIVLNVIAVLVIALLAYNLALAILGGA